MLLNPRAENLELEVQSKWLTLILVKVSE
jgi:hypothetical protein